MSFKWLNSTITINCHRCNKDVAINLADFDIDEWVEENSEDQMGSTYRYTVRPETCCPHCNASINGEIEFIEYPEGRLECVNCSGESFENLNENNFVGVVEFSL